MIKNVIVDLQNVDIPVRVSGMLVQRPASRNPTIGPHGYMLVVIPVGREGSDTISTSHIQSGIFIGVT